MADAGQGLHPLHHNEYSGCGAHLQGREIYAQGTLDDARAFIRVAGHVHHSSVRRRLLQLQHDYERGDDQVEQCQLSSDQSVHRVHLLQKRLLHYQ